MRRVSKALTFLCAGLLGGAALLALLPEGSLPKPGGLFKVASTVGGCPDFLSFLVPDALHCKLCRTQRLDGLVGDCSCEFETVDTATYEYFHPILDQLRQTPFFRYFKVHLSDACPFWDDSEESCALKDCAVETCPLDEVPPNWRESDDAESTEVTPAEEGCLPEWARGPADGKSQAAGGLGSVEVAGGLSEAQKWSEGMDDSELWIEQDEASGMVYVDLLENPERYTGYRGDSPHRIWAAIYNENCFEESGQCLEKRVFYRLFSGLQASITTHIAKSFYFGSDFGETPSLWGPNTALFVERVGRHPDRLENLYFAYLFLLRATAKAAQELESFDYSTGDAAADGRARSLVRALLRPDHPLVSSATSAQVCQKGFDERKLFQTAGNGDFKGGPIGGGFNPWSRGAGNPRDLTSSGLEGRFGVMLSEDAVGFAALGRAEAAVELRGEFQARFRNISRIMDCVGCEKCRLWGKLQVLGLGTALKILMSPEDLAQDDASAKRGYSLQRNEVIALVNTLSQLSYSVKSVNEWRSRELRIALAELAIRACLLVGGAALLVSALARRRSAKGP
mmetsp:Transcript_56901/g.128941  ORF Transcript_56901/g.128941 Transcript_56901/m.128941 type:complete len:567 (+) Transcript_56901:89-1789(+)|eukprot:CAMPEP_0172609410 /NCGR_PEP_ID=MMETSP1068-20121228/29409_1 /TAXON_ID=35684 /ORGANISM="Pseudopedinella elastica, Strain CCMP716" /LENGTH=566 /DNA_ID=CAMNT_0013412921 /DNA_START=84 /DNA_END=1784 /DNA_ORIENTATION=-